MGSGEPPSFPVLDFTKEDLNPGTTTWIETRGQVREALEEYGFFMVEYNKISPQLRDDVFKVLRELFEVPTDTKMKNRYEKPLNGYVGQIAKLPLHESMGIDNATTLEGVQDFACLMWPGGNDLFCANFNVLASESIYEYAKLAAELDQLVTRMIFESYGVYKYHEAYDESTTYLLRLLKNRAPKLDEPNLGFVTHTDKSFTTILHQNEINGLEVDAKDGSKINVEYSSPSSFVVIAGDALMAWSNDRIISPSHRVIMNGKVDRYSLGLFAFNSGMIEVPEELIDEEHPIKYKPLDHIGLLYFFRTEEGYNSKCPIKAHCGI